MLYALVAILCENLPNSWGNSGESNGEASALGILVT